MQDIITEPPVAAVLLPSQVTIQEPPVAPVEPEPMAAPTIINKTPVVEDDVMSNTSETLDVNMPNSPHASPKRQPYYNSRDDEEESEGDEPI
jgi:hypothetical protein